MLMAFILLAFAGALAGFSAGLFGIGGGIIIVPSVYFILGVMGTSNEVSMHLALGTSIASIFFTSLRSLQKHNQKRAVDKSILKSWLPWIGLGAFIGAVLAGLLPGRDLTLIFSIFMFIFALQFLVGRKEILFGHKMPEGIWTVVIGGVIGTLSSMMGIGGGVLGVALMTGFQRPIHQAVATASGFGLAIGAIGMIGHIYSGWAVMGRPEFSLGYVYLPALIFISIMTFFFTPLGVYCAHKLPEKMLKRYFALGLLLVSFSLFFESFKALFS